MNTVTSASAVVAVPCAHGLHLRPAAMVVAECQRFDCDIRLSSGGAQADGKALLSLLQVGATSGASLEITAEGAQAREAVEALVELFKSGRLLCEEEYFPTPHS